MSPIIPITPAIGSFVLSSTTIARIKDFISGPHNERTVKLHVEYGQNRVSFFGVASGWINIPNQRKAFVYGQGRGETPDEAVEVAITDARRSAMERHSMEVIA